MKMYRVRDFYDRFNLKHTAHINKYLRDGIYDTSDVDWVNITKLAPLPPNKGEVAAYELECEQFDDYIKDFVKRHPMWMLCSGYTTGAGHIFLFGCKPKAIEPSEIPECEQEIFIKSNGKIFIATKAA